MQRVTLIAAGVVVGLVGSVADARAQDLACEEPHAACSTTNGDEAFGEDEREVAVLVEPLLRDLRACSIAAGARGVTPAVSLAWDVDGNPVTVKLQVGGYERLPCSAEVFARLARSTRTRAGAFHCSLRCDDGEASMLEAGLRGEDDEAVLARPGDVPPLPEAAPSRPPASPVTPRYGWQTFLADMGSTSLVVAGMATQSAAGIAIGCGAYLVGGPIVHVAHDNTTGALGSLGIRIFVPLATAFLGAAVADVGRHSADTVGVGAGVGLATGLVAATAFDALVLAKEPRDKPPPEPTSRSASRVTAAPAVVVAPGRGDVGVRGTF
jgi:hypothetical protein